MKCFFTFLKTELKLSLRDMNMVIFAVIMPLVIFIILGIIYGTKPAYDGADYTFLDQSFGAVSAVAVCASGLMGLPLAVSGLREMKILKRLRVTPVSPVLILGVELAMYVVYCAASIAMLAVAALLWGVQLRGSLPAFLGSWALTMISTLSIGMLAGGVAKDTRQASAIASILYFPMLIFSGTTLPIEAMPPVMQKVVSFFPLTQGLTMMKNAFLGIGAGGILLPMCIMLGVTALCAILAVRFFRWE
ncbi:Inner membrane transport permease yhhJ [uncultured Eubacterium sp.]|uniref:ABC transporter permease n=1 Tax=Brotomerdimonas butyrica TaxID=2981721 RepID=UPI0008222A27|nr:ABC transporter permease [Brotomerdimonas butyrica]MCU6755793.1 ABC transporter permease [Brotomerdimonas butyrica]SCH48633.1 Inner membrane transport permease yhhJ [uncultured Eubacterium sp.]